MSDFHQVRTRLRTPRGAPLDRGDRRRNLEAMWTSPDRVVREEDEVFFLVANSLKCHRLLVGQFTSTGAKLEPTGAPLTAYEDAVEPSTRRQVVHFSAAGNGAVFGCP
jgi:hypothetical protein